MSKQGSPLEIQVLRESAEARVRKGDAYADIARDLGISQTTLGNWAGEGRWRKKHIAFEQNEERGKALLVRIAETRIRENEESEKRALKAKELGAAATTTTIFFWDEDNDDDDFSPPLARPATFLQLGGRRPDPCSPEDDSGEGRTTAQCLLPIPHSLLPTLTSPDTPI